MNPQLSAEQIDELYRDRDVDHLTGVYSRIAASPSVIAEYDGRLDALERMLPERGRLLDFGCGSGVFFERAQLRGWDAHGTELGVWARQAADMRQLKNLHIGTLTELSFPTESFDVVHAAQVFEHLARPKIELAEIRRIMRPGGVLYIDVPNYRTLSIVLGRDDFMLNEPPQHVNYFMPSTIRSMLASNGFAVHEVASGGGLKWENILGRSIKSDRAKAYGLVADGQAHETDTRAAIQPATGSSRVKSVLRATIVKPLFYDALKVGMVLFAYASRTPDSPVAA